MGTCGAGGAKLCGGAGTDAGLVAAAPPLIDNSRIFDASRIRVNSLGPDGPGDAGLFKTGSNAGGETGAAG
jgi:hypothetical protein